MVDKQKFNQLEKLIDKYATAIANQNWWLAEHYMLQVEREADRTGYTNHRRLKILHTQFAEAAKAIGLVYE